MNKVKLLNGLTSILEKVNSEGFYADRGICGLLECELDPELDNNKIWQTVHATLVPYFISWPQYSGHKCYPVPSASIYMNNEEAFYLTENLWEGEYGALRLDLLNHIIEQVRKEVYQEAGF